MLYYHLRSARVNRREAQKLNFVLNIKYELWKGCKITFLYSFRTNDNVLFPKIFFIILNSYWFYFELFVWNNINDGK